ncbi:MAG: response regulator transcription factor [Deltaproteobacteria bacterium]|nr:response regulator transcription factor [Deltaproteobacteria bacterium]
MNNQTSIPPIRILIADDHPVVCEGLAALINRTPDMTVVGEAQSGRAAVTLFAECAPDLALMDLRMPDLDGVGAIREIRAMSPTARFLVLTTYDGDEDIYRALHAGAQGYMLKDAPRQELLAAIRAIYRGETRISPAMAGKLAARMREHSALTPRESEVLRLLVDGRNNKDIGITLSISEGTVKLHVNKLFAKLGVGSRTEAAHVALKRGILHLE